MNVQAFDRVQLKVPDLASGIKAFNVLLAEKAHAITDSDGATRAWYDLGNTVLELSSGPPNRRSAISELTLQADKISDADDTEQETYFHSAAVVKEQLSSTDNSLNLSLTLSDGAATEALRRDGALNPSALRCDHLVLQTRNADQCIELFANKLGLRLALDKYFEQRQARLLFFRAGKMTLEVIENTDADIDQFWGLALACENIDDHIARLRARDVEVSDRRDGIKDGTLVATVKDETVGIPILLIEHVKPD